MALNENADHATVKSENDRLPDAATSVQNTERPDAYQSGGNDRQQRRDLKMNVQDQGGQAQQHPDKPAGIHSTGSFTGTAEKPEVPSE